VGGLDNIGRARVGGGEGLEAVIVAKLFFEMRIH
jgi:hypothetical protein